MVNRRAWRPSFAGRQARGPSTRLRTGSRAFEMRTAPTGTGRGGGSGAAGEFVCARAAVKV